MPALDPSVAAIRIAVRRALERTRQDPGPELEDPAFQELAVDPTATAVEREASPTDSEPTEPPLALVACSGGPDSLALAAAAAFVAPRIGWRAGLITVDHGLQDGSDDRAQAVAEWGRAVGLTPALAVSVTVSGRAGGPEAAARTARYEALTKAAREHAAAAVLLGHTRDDQAETVLLALARGAGPRGLAGMPARRRASGVSWLRPMLEIRRRQTETACRVLGLTPWQDPHNIDPTYARSRVRGSVLPALVEALGDRVVDNLARSAQLIAADTAALDTFAAEALTEARRPGQALAIESLRYLPDALRTRALHTWARELGAPGAALSHRHVAALDALVTDWRGQGPVHLPGGILIHRRANHLTPL